MIKLELKERIEKTFENLKSNRHDTILFYREVIKLELLFELFCEQFDEEEEEEKEEVF